MLITFSPRIIKLLCWCDEIFAENRSPITFNSQGCCSKAVCQQAGRDPNVLILLQQLYQTPPWHLISMGKCRSQTATKSPGSCLWDKPSKIALELRYTCANHLSYCISATALRKIIFLCVCFKVKERRGPMTCYNKAAQWLLWVAASQSNLTAMGERMERHSTWWAPALNPKESPRAGITTLPQPNVGDGQKLGGNPKEHCWILWWVLQ